MTIVYEGPGDIFKASQKTLVCTINVVGAMGKGIAKDCKERFPGLFEAYLESLLFDTERKAMLYMREAMERNCHTLVMFDPPESPHRNVLLFPTKLHWAWDSPLELIEENLDILSRQYQAMGIESLAVPPLGCGNGHRVYQTEVRPLIHRYLGDDIPIPVGIYLG